MTEEEEEQELRDTIERVREYVAECLAVVDALFPEDARKPRTEPQNRGQMWMHSSARGPQPNDEDSE